MSMYSMRSTRAAEQSREIHEQCQQRQRYDACDHSGARNVVGIDAMANAKTKERDLRHLLIP
jgi:hypothetical protein